MIKWLQTPDETKKNAYIQIAEKIGMSPFAVEKDWWVVQTLRIVFETAIAKHLVFKGGTSLSKAWNLIKRFSEDVDLAIEREFLGFTGELSKKDITALRKKAGEYTATTFLEELRARFAAKGFKVDLKIEDAKSSDEDPRIIEIYYPNVIDSLGYLQPRVLIEIGCRSLREPFSNQTFTSLLDAAYPDADFAQKPIVIPTVNPERTFLEKIFLLHEEFQRPLDKIRVDRLSRHLYDVVQLSKTEFAEKALNDPELYETIVHHRYKFTRIGGIDYNGHQPQTINPIPIKEIIEEWEKDYNTMIEQMIYGEDKPTFDEIIEELNKLKSRINSLTWKFKEALPLPNSQ